MKVRRWCLAFLPLLISTVVLVGCAKRPSMVQASAPAPAGSAAAGVSTSEEPPQSGAGSETIAAAQPGEQLIAAARPTLREYAAVPELQDVHFGFDKYSIRTEDVTVLDANAQWLKSNPTYLVLIEGHCDERGTNEYNIALGQHRAKSVMDYLVSQGVLASRITTISYGEERPLCTEHTEDCWGKNRRGHFLVKAQ